MTNPSKQRGTAWETAVVGFLQEHGHPNVERKAQQGANDCGDLTGIPDTVAELKATKTLDLAGAIDEAAVEAANAGARYYVAIIKRRGKPISQAYVIQTLEQYADKEQKL